MAKQAVTHRLNNKEIDRILHSPQGPVAKDLLKRGFRVQTQARKNLGGAQSLPKRIDTGLLRASIAVSLRKNNRGLVVRIGTNVFYAPMVHEGTGLYGPRHAVIKPKRARYLRFKPKGSSKYIYRRSVKGMRPNPFLVRALPAAKIK